MTRRFAVYLGAPVAAALLASIAGCGSAREPVTAEATTSCATCHGDRSPGIEPGDPHAAPGFNGGTDVNGRTAGDPAATAIGAHAIHLTGGALGVAVSCDQCHVVPATVDAAGHLDNQVTIAFGARAKKNGLAPAYDPATQTCSNTYCHGGTPGWKANPVVAPKWSQGNEAIVCGACHDLPPPSPVHVKIDKATQGCGTSTNPAFACHPAGYSPFTVDPKLHMDGQICPPFCTPVSP
ncbi:CxxxxCH/CxxCH domain c-type cytochrome [Anaeromyxobacter diazotrophicus]|nr:CxxxxCH/CxxCH domain-containing protein [Anaeromyxobacter diazotrophicus]